MAFFDGPLPLAQRAHELDVLQGAGAEFPPHTREWAVMVRSALEGPRTGAQARTLDRLFGFTGPGRSRHATRDLAAELGVSQRTVERWRKTEGQVRRPSPMNRDRLMGLALNRYVSQPPAPSVARRLREARREGLTVTWSGDFSAVQYVRGMRVRMLREDKNIFGISISEEQLGGFVAAALEGRWREAATELEAAFWDSYFKSEEELDGAEPELVHTHELIIAVGG